MRYLSFMNEFIVGLVIGLAVGMIVGMFFIALLSELEGGAYEENQE